MTGMRCEACLIIGGSHESWCPHDNSPRLERDPEPPYSEPDPPGWWDRDRVYEELREKDMWP